MYVKSNIPVHTQVEDTAGCLSNLYSPLPNRTLTPSSILSHSHFQWILLTKPTKPSIPTSSGSCSLSPQSQAGAQCSGLGVRTGPTLSQSDREGILPQAGFMFCSFSCTSARRQVAFTRSNHAATQRALLNAHATYGGREEKWKVLDPWWQELSHWSHHPELALTLHFQLYWVANFLITEATLGFL